MPRFTESQIRAVGELIGLPRLTPDAVPRRTSVAIDEVCQTLGLPEPPHRELLSETLWLGGSSVARWLTRGAGMGDVKNTDVDFFVPTVTAFNAAGRFLLSRGFTFRTFRSRWRMCQLCGGPAELIADGVPDVPFLPPLERFRCPDCGDFGGVDAATMTPDRLPVFTAQRLTDRAVLALELKAPDGAVVHISSFSLDPDPQELFLQMDFSVTQFVLDDACLHFSPHAWTDLMSDRMRLIKPANRIQVYERMKKYQRYGFRPYLGTRLKIELRRRIG